jgi:hypothetical protein
MRFRVGFHGLLGLFVLLYMLVVALVVFGLELAFNIVKLLVLGVVALCREVSRRREAKAAKAARPLADSRALAGVRDAQARPGLTGREVLDVPRRVPLSVTGRSDGRSA